MPTKVGNYQAARSGRRPPWWALADSSANQGWQLPSRPLWWTPTWVGAGRQRCQPRLATTKPPALVDAHLGGRWQTALPTKVGSYQAARFGRRPPWWALADSSANQGWQLPSRPLWWTPTLVGAGRQRCQPRLATTKPPALVDAHLGGRWQTAVPTKVGNYQAARSGRRPPWWALADSGANQGWQLPGHGPPL
ncbi:hypothetical protein SRABI66_02195 [Stenotrophomonas lactitubi]|nr:hypothetical protein SRABI66_02195 [Stenotrophomonas lactitubi]